MPGYVSVVDSVGTIRGYITEAELSGEPGKLPLGTGAVPVNGFEVRDLHGTLTGYMLSGNGFIDPTSAKDPKVVDSLLLNPLQVIDSEGKLVGAVEWLARTRAGTARTR